MINDYCSLRLSCLGASQPASQNEVVEIRACFYADQRISLLDLEYQSRITSVMTGLLRRTLESRVDQSNGS